MLINGRTQPYPCYISPRRLGQCWTHSKSPNTVNWVIRYSTSKSLETVYQYKVNKVIKCKWLTQSKDILKVPFIISMSSVHSQSRMPSKILTSFFSFRPVVIQYITGTYAIWHFFQQMMHVCTHMCNEYGYINA